MRFRLEVEGFHRLKDNSRGPVELTGSVAPGDILIALNGSDLEELGIEGAVQALRVLEENSAERVYLRFKYGDSISTTSGSLHRGADILDMFGTTEGSYGAGLVTSPTTSAMRTNRVAPQISSIEEIQKSLKTESAYPSCCPTSVFGGDDGYSSKLLEDDVRNLALKERNIVMKSLVSDLDGGSTTHCVHPSFHDIRNSLILDFSSPTHMVPDILSEQWIQDREGSLDDELCQLVSHTAQALDSFKRRSSRGKSLNGLRGLLPAKAITDRLMQGAMKTLRHGSDKHFDQLRSALGNWAQSFSPSAAMARHSQQADRDLLSFTKDLMTLFVVMNVSWEFVCMGKSPDTGENDYGRAAIPALHLHIGLFRHRPGGPLWTDRSAAKYLSSLEGVYLRLDVALAACSAVNFSESIREVLAVASRSLSLQISLSSDDFLLPPSAVAAKIMGAIGDDLAPSHLGLALVRSMEALAGLSSDLLVALAVAVFPVLRPASLHRLVLEGRVPRKNRLYATYMLRLLESDSCGCLADGDCVRELAAAVVDLSRVDAKASAAFLEPLERLLHRAADEGADLQETGLLLLREGLGSLAAPVLAHCLRHERSERRELLLAAAREGGLKELEEDRELAALTAILGYAVCWEGSEPKV